MSNNDLYITQLRKTHRHARSCLSTDQLRSNSTGLIEQIATLNEFVTSKNVASYIAIRGEIDSLPLMHCYPDKFFYLPVLREQNMFFAPWKPGATLVKKAFGLLEPDTQEREWINAKDLDLVLVPLVVFDPQCNRIGQGGGFYDRTFEFLHNRAGIEKPVLVGLAHECQLEPTLMVQAWDVPLDFVVTESSVYYRNW